jgi:CO/xanthine dehydrogenase Mo-binding subunit
MLEVEQASLDTEAQERLSQIRTQLGIAEPAVPEAAPAVAPATEPATAPAAEPTPQATEGSSPA